MMVVVTMVVNQVKLLEWFLVKMVVFTIVVNQGEIITMVIS